MKIFSWLTRASGFLSNHVSGVALCLFVVGLTCYSVSRGADTSYDFLNVRWYMGWSLLNGNFDLGGVASTRSNQLPLVEVFQVLLHSPNIWWLPPLVNGLAHSSISLIVYSTCRQLLPMTDRWLAIFLAFLSLLSPLVLSIFGTSSGHFYAGLALAAALRLLVGSNQDSSKCFLAGLLVALALIAKASALALVPSLLISAALILGTAGRTLSVLNGLVTGYVALALPWAAFSLIKQGHPIDVLWFPGFPRLSFLPAERQAFAVGVTLAVFIAISWSFRHFLKKQHRRAEAILYPAIIVVLFAGLLISAHSIRKTAIDYRYQVKSVAEFLNRMLHTGDAKQGYQTLDLEIGYFDTRVPIAACLLGSVVISLSLRRSADGKRLSGIVAFCSLPIIMNIWSTGYTRYATEILPLIPVGIVALTMGGFCHRWVGRSVLIFSAFVLLFPILPNGRLSGGTPRHGQVATDSIFEPFLSNDEVKLISDLLPEDEFVFGSGTLISYVPARLNRTDLEWSFERVSRTNISGLPGSFSIIYRPSEAGLLDRFTSRGVELHRCEVLRFRNTSLGWCSASMPT